MSDFFTKLSRSLFEAGMDATRVFSGLCLCFCLFYISVTALFMLVTSCVCHIRQPITVKHFLLHWLSLDLVMVTIRPPSSSHHSRSRLKFLLDTLDERKNDSQCFKCVLSFCAHVTLRKRELWEMHFIPDEQIKHFLAVLVGSAALMPWLLRWLFMDLFAALSYWDCMYAGTC